MKREDLEKLGLSKEQIDAVMAENGKDVEGQKTRTTAAETERDALKTQLTEAGKQIEAFKGMDIDGVKKSADEWKAKAEKAQAEAAAQINQLRFDHALDGAISGAKAKNPKAVKALLDTDLLKLADDGSISGLKEQLDKIKSENDYLFEGEANDPKIVSHGNNTTVTTDSLVAAMRRGAGLPPEQGK